MVLYVKNSLIPPNVFFFWRSLLISISLLHSHQMQKLMGSSPLDLAKSNLAKSGQISRNALCPCGSKKRYKWYFSIFPSFHESNCDLLNLDTVVGADQVSSSITSSVYMFLNKLFSSVFTRSQKSCSK